MKLHGLESLRCFGNALKAGAVPEDSLEDVKRKQRDGNDHNLKKKIMTR